MSLLALAAPVAGQTGAIVQATPPAMAVERLNQNLTRLSRQPTDMEALIGAGMASYELGDAQAANGFFTRANLVNPREGRVKLGLALVSVALKQPREAAAYFDEATALGETADAFLGERALIYDLIGQQDKAQRDYVTALRANPGNTELIRAYAVSLGISGRVDLAEAQLRPLLYRSDRAAWRDRTMILAMNGRTTEARKIAQTIMPRSLADAMEPYLVRMGSLTAAQKAAATHYGQFPVEGLRLATMTSPPPTPAAARPDARSSRSARDRRKGAAAKATVAAPAEDNSLLAAMPHGDMPPAMVQAVPASNAISATPSRGAVTTDDDDPDGYTPAERRQATRAATAYATPVPVTTGGRVTASYPSVVSASQAPVMVPPVPRATSPAPTASPSPSSMVQATAPQPMTVQRNAAAPVVAAASSTMAPVAASVAQRPSQPVVIAAVPSAAVPPVQGPTMGDNPVHSDTPVVAPTPSTRPTSAPITTPSLAQTASLPTAAIEPVSSQPVAQPSAASPVGPAPVNTPQPGFSVAPVTGTASAAPLRTLAAIMADIQVQEDAERATIAPAVDLDEVARLQAAKRKTVADKAKKDAATKAKAEADAKLKAAAKAEAEEKARIKANPARIWIQIATGRDPAALAFDMRRLRKTYSVLAGESASTAEWGATRRLLVGPYVSVTKAKAVLGDLKKAGSDGFVWQSEAGETIAPLSGK